MLDLIIMLTVVPTLAISLWTMVVSHLSTRTWLIYRTTGMLGTPVHEGSHALVCLLFGMRLNEVALYRPHAESGQLGFVSFRYNPRSWFQVIGLAVQGIAPLLASGAIAVLTLDLIQSPGRPNQGMLPLLAWCWELAGWTVQSFITLATGGVKGVVLAAGLMVICMHGIPSWQDVKVGLRGLAFIVVLISILGLIDEAYWLMGSPFGPSVDRWVDLLAGEFERGLWWALHGAVLTVTLAVVASLVLIVIPAGFISLLSAARRPLED